MSYLHRVTPNKNTTSGIEGKYNEKGQLLDANTKEVLVQGQIDRGHKHGYEERVMRECAERCHMTQKEYSQMMQNSKLYQFESSHNNRTHKFESNNYKQQLHNCFEVIRDFKGKNRNRVIEKYGKSEFTFSKQAKHGKDYFSVKKSDNHLTYNENIIAKYSSIINDNSSHEHSSTMGKSNSIGFGKVGITGGKIGSGLGDSHGGLNSSHNSTGSGHVSSSSGHIGSGGGHGGSSGGHGSSGSGHGSSSGGHGGSGSGHGGSSGGHGGSSGSHGGASGGHGR